MKDKQKRSDLMKQMRERKAAGRTMRKKTAHALRKMIKTVEAKPDAKVAMIKVLISMPPRLDAQLTRNAERHGISKSLLVRQLIVKNQARVGKP